MISQKYIQQLLQDYVDSGKLSGITLPQTTLKDIDEISSDVRNMFVSAVSNVIHSFSHSDGDVFVKRSDTKAPINVYISVNDEALRRESLHRMSTKKYRESGSLSIEAGKGVYDIIGLFVHGYSIKGRLPYGFWVHYGGESMEAIKAKRHREPNDFMDRLVDEINSKYGSMCLVELNSRYK